jgi:MoxR-like ATPase
VRQVLCPVLVGRQEEASRLQAALAAAGSGQGGLVLVTGEAGVGKSRLVRETARLAGLRGFVVLAGRIHASWTRSGLPSAG